MGKDKMLGKARRLYGLNDGGLDKELKRVGRGQMKLPAKVKPDLSEVVLLRNSEKIPFNEFMSIDYHGNKLNVVPFIINAVYAGWEFFPTFTYGGVGSTEYLWGCISAMCKDSIQSTEDYKRWFCSNFTEFVGKCTDPNAPVLGDASKFLGATSMCGHVGTHSDVLALNLILAAFVTPDSFFNMCIDMAVWFIASQLRLKDPECFLHLVDDYTHDLRTQWNEHCTYKLQAKNLNFDLTNLASIYVWFAWAIDIHRKYFLSNNRELRSIKNLDEIFASYDLDSKLEKCFKFRGSPLKRYMLGEISLDDFVAERNKGYKTRISDLMSESALCTNNDTYEKSPLTILSIAMNKGYGACYIRYITACEEEREKGLKVEKELEALKSEFASSDKKIKSLTKGIDNREKRIEQLKSKCDELESKVRELQALDKQDKSVAEENVKLKKKLKDAFLSEDRLKAENNKLLKELASLKDEGDALESENEHEDIEVMPEIESVSFEDKLLELRGVRVILLGGIGNLDVELNKLGLQAIRVNSVNDPNLNKDVDFGVIMTNRVSHTLMRRCQKLFRSKHIPTLYYKGSNKEMLVDLLYDHKVKGEKSNEKIDS